MLWRGAVEPGAPAPPEPWPARVAAFRLACAIHAGHRERDLHNTLEMLTAFLAAKSGG